MSPFFCFYRHSSEIIAPCNLLQAPRFFVWAIWGFTNLVLKFITNRMNQEQKKYKIGQAAEMLGLETYVLRFWETEFSQLRPKRSSKGQRYYTSEHLVLLRRIKKLLYEDKLTIDGARMRLEEQDIRSGALKEIKNDLLQIKDLLR